LSIFSIEHDRSSSRGICGILPAAFLAEVERRFLGGRPITEYFDMVAGTSTGGIIALALGAGMSSAAIRDMYVERGGLIFPPRCWIARQLLQLRRLVRYGYDAKTLEEELSRIFHRPKRFELLTPRFVVMRCI
jgi:uncharacterized protein